MITSVSSTEDGYFLINNNIKVRLLNSSLIDQENYDFDILYDEKTLTEEEVDIIFEEFIQNFTKYINLVEYKNNDKTEEVEKQKNSLAFIFKNLLNYIRYSGWTFKGKRLSENDFNIIVNDFKDVKNIPSYNEELDQLILIRGKQTVIKIQLDKKYSEWNIIYPQNFGKLNFNHISFFNNVKNKVSL